MQITSGLVTLTQGSSLVQGNSAVDWTQVEPNSLFITSGQVFTINSVDAGAKQLHISPNWTSSTVADNAYTIVRDFTTSLQLPLLNPGDLEASAIFSRAMKILDTIGSSSGSPTVTDVVITKTAHAFIVGNVLRLNGGVWTLCTSSDATTSLGVGFVSKVVDADHFWLRMVGRVGDVVGSPIQGITLTTGTLYYLRVAPLVVSVEVTPGVFENRQVNICTGLLADAGELLVPVLQADSASSGYILGMASSLTNVFGPGKPGLVPDPGSVTGKVLTDSGWALQGIGLGAIQAKHLLATALSDPVSSLEWDNFEDQINNTPVHGYIMDLHRRISSIEASASVEPYTKRVITRKEFNTGLWSWSIPGGTKLLALTVITGEYFMSIRNNPGNSRDPSTTTKSGNVYARMLINVEGAATLSGNIYRIQNPGETYSLGQHAKVMVALDSQEIVSVVLMPPVTASGFASPGVFFSLPSIRPNLPPYYHVVSYFASSSSTPSYPFHIDYAVSDPNRITTEPPSAYCSLIAPGGYAAFSGVVVIERGRSAV